MRDRLEDRHRAFDVADLKLVRRSQEGFLQLARAAQRDDPTAMDEGIPIDDRLALEKVVAREQDGPARAAQFRNVVRSPIRMLTSMFVNGSSKTSTWAGCR